MAFQLHYFAHFIHSLIDNIKNNVAKHDKEIGKDSFLLFYFLVERMFIVSETWINNFPLKIPAKVDKSELRFIRSLETCDQYLTFYRYCQNHSTTYLDETVSFLLRTFIEHKNSNIINFTFFANEIKDKFPHIDHALESMVKKLSKREVLKGKSIGILKFAAALENVKTFDGIAASFQSINGPHCYLNYNSVLEVMVR